MLSRDALIGNVLAATDKLVQQVGQGDWSSVAKTVEQRRMFLEALSSEPQTGEHDFLQAMRAAVAESDAAVAVMSKAKMPSVSTYTPSQSSASALTYGPGKR